MIISDLNYLEAVGQEVAIVGSGGTRFNTDIYKKFNVYANIDVRDYKDFDVKVKVYGNAAFAEADADAYGNNTSSQTFTFAQTTPYSSESSSTSIALTD
ncbi:MAG: hypothetical protein HC865_09780 [Cyanobacteria bacterium RU_5_0]|nr:hypothetical protein [Cyanobacteria bacterium RU_5_0]